MKGLAQIRNVHAEHADIAQEKGAKSASDTVGSGILIQDVQEQPFEIIMNFQTNISMVLSREAPDAAQNWRRSLPCRGLST